MNARVETDVSAVEADVVITRTFDAPRELVFRVWSEAEHVAQWWGPTGFKTASCELDFRVGGILHMQLLGPDGVTYPCEGVFREIVQPERIVYDGAASDGHACGSGLPPQSRVTVTFTEHEGKTTVRIRARLKSMADREAAMTKGYGTGWTTSFERLDAYLAKKLSSASTSDPSVQ